MASPQGVFYAQLGKRIREARKNRKLTQERLATAVRLTRTSITNIECGRQPVLAHHLVRVAHVLGVTVEVLLPQLSDSPSSQLDAKLRDLALPDEKRVWISRIVTPIT